MGTSSRKRCPQEINSHCRYTLSRMHTRARARARSHAFRQREEAPVRMEQDGRGGVANYMQVSSAGFPSPLLRSTSEEMTASWQALQLEASPSPPPPPPPPSSQDSLC